MRVFALRSKKAGEGNRTLVISLEGWSFTTKLHPRTTPENIRKKADHVNTKQKHCHQKQHHPRKNVKFCCLANRPGVCRIVELFQMSDY